VLKTTANQWFVINDNVCLAPYLQSIQILNTNRECSRTGAANATPRQTRFSPIQVFIAILLKDEYLCDVGRKTYERYKVHLNAWTAIKEHSISKKAARQLLFFVHGKLRIILLEITG